MAEITEVPPPGKRKSPLRELLETIILALVVALVIRTFVVEVYRVDGSSMENTLHTEERVLVNKFLFRWGIREPEHGDIIVFQYPRQPDRDFIKRVVAVAGDTVELREGKVYVNGILFPEVPTVRMTDQDFPPRVVPEGAVWVLGDNRNNSEDSRYFGQVPLRNIRGLAFARIWPLSRASGFTNPVTAAGVNLGR
ncbi:MAG: signal peptidase I [Bacillota bacterium]